MNTLKEKDIELLQVLEDFFKEQNVEWEVKSKREKNENRKYIPPTRFVNVKMHDGTTTRKYKTHYKTYEINILEINEHYTEHRVCSVFGDDRGTYHPIFSTITLSIEKGLNRLERGAHLYCNLQEKIYQELGHPINKMDPKWAPSSNWKYFGD